MQALRSETSQQPFEAQNVGQRLRVLLVEGEPIVRLDIAEFLARCGHDCAQACTVGAALTLVHGQSFDVALINVSLEHQFTDQVVRALRAKGVPCVLVTAYTRHELPPAFAGLRLIEKPFQESDLIDALHDCVRLPA
jgi:CheY-like chemotaxis protein